MRKAEIVKSRERLSAMMVFANTLIGVTVVILSGFRSAVESV
ncbi:hypothetical protein [Archaeoglobus sp.]